MAHVPPALELISHSSYFAKKCRPHSRTANERRPVKYSGSWISPARRVPKSTQPADCLLPAFASMHRAITRTVAKTGHPFGLGSCLQLQQRNCLRFTRSSFNSVA